MCSLNEHHGHDFFLCKCSHGQNLDLDSKVRFLVSAARFPNQAIYLLVVISEVDDIDGAAQEASGK